MSDPRDLPPAPRDTEIPDHAGMFPGAPTSDAMAAAGADIRAPIHSDTPASEQLPADALALASVVTDPDASIRRAQASGGKPIPSGLPLRFTTAGTEGDSRDSTGRRTPSRMQRIGRGAGAVVALAAVVTVIGIAGGSDLRDEKASSQTPQRAEQYQVKLP